MKKYLRFGEIPANEKSINWWKVSLDDQSDFSWALENFGYDAAIRMIKNVDSVLEEGVSVFELDENEQPVLESDTLKKLYNSYIEQGRKSYIVIGEEVGRGSENEPLIVNVEIVEER